MIRYHRVFVRHRLSTFHYEWDNLFFEEDMPEQGLPSLGDNFVASRSDEPFVRGRKVAFVEDRLCESWRT